MMILTDATVIVSLNKEILNLLNEESISGARSGRASLEFRWELYRKCLKMGVDRKSAIKLF